MINLMEHIEYFYEPIPTKEGQVFVYLKDGQWQLLEDGEWLVKTKSSTLILDMLRDFEADLDVFKAYLEACVATEALKHIHHLKLCQELIGAEKINSAMVGMEAFVEEVKKAIKKAGQPKLEVVK